MVNKSRQQNNNNKKRKAKARAKAEAEHGSYQRKMDASWKAKVRRANMGSAFSTPFVGMNLASGASKMLIGDPSSLLLDLDRNEIKERVLARLFGETYKP